MSSCFQFIRTAIISIIFLLIFVASFMYNNRNGTLYRSYAASCKAVTDKIHPTSVWNPSSKAKRNAIAFLYNDQVQHLAPTIAILDTLFKDNISSDIVIFHTAYPLKAHMKTIASATKRRVIFYNVDDAFTSFPKGFNPYETEPTWTKRGKWNYQHMCRFWFKLVMDIPLVHEYEYFMRLDDDSRIRGVWFDVFQFMKMKNAVYFGNTEEADPESGLPGLMQLKTLTLNYTEQYGLVPKDPTRLARAFDIPNHIRLYNTNFDLIKVDFFRRPEIRQWNDVVDQSFGIYKYRWGDHVLRYLTTALFARSDEVLVRTNFNLPYCHKC
jgi:hypothetical protein